MKLQQLSVIFVIIILPIAIVLDTYVNNLIDVSNKQKNYNTILYNSTYDAVRAYQMNTLNNSFASVNTSRDRDISATVNSFFNSLASGFSSSGYTKNDLKDYIPAMLFTLYDGYYVYGPYENNATISNNKPEFYGEGDNNTKRNIEYGLKPYNYYSCEYSDGSTYDLVVNYTLDNYISVSGWYGAAKTPILAAGYYINPGKIEINDATKEVKIKSNNGQSILLQPEELSEYISTYDNYYDSSDGKNRILESTELSEARKYRYINYNEEKYYFDSYNDDASKTKRESNTSYDRIPIFKLDGNLRTYINANMLNILQSFTGQSLLSENSFKDVNYYYYYKNAKNFSTKANEALKNIKLIKNESNGTYSNIKTQFFNKNYKIITKDGDEIKSDKGNSSHIKSDYSDVNGEVFNLNPSNGKSNDPEMEDSAFNRHRMDVIISSIESALSDSITNFNKFQSSSYSYRMPTITESDWYKVANNLSVVSFMQGIGVGNYKYYNNYAIVTNTKNKEFVSKDSIYVQDKTNFSDDQYLNNTLNKKIYYHNPKCNEYNGEKKDSMDGVIGYRVIDYEIQSVTHNYKRDSRDVSQTVNYYMQPGTGAYECVVSFTRDTISFDNLMSLKTGTENKENYQNTYSLAVDKAFVQALAREKNAETKVYEIYNLR